MLSHQMVKCPRPTKSTKLKKFVTQKTISRSVGHVLVNFFDSTTLCACTPRMLSHTSVQFIPALIPLNKPSTSYDSGIPFQNQLDLFSRFVSFHRQNIFPAYHLCKSCEQQIQNLFPFQHTKLWYPERLSRLPKIIYSAVQRSSALEIIILYWSNYIPPIVPVPLCHTADYFGMLEHFIPNIKILFNKQKGVIAPVARSQQ